MLINCVNSSLFLFSSSIQYQTLICRQISTFPFSILYSLFSRYNSQFQLIIIFFLILLVSACLLSSTCFSTVKLYTSSNNFLTLNWVFPAFNEILYLGYLFGISTAFFVSFCLFHLHFQ